MEEKSIECPQCRTPISLTGALTADIREHYRRQAKEAIERNQQKVSLIQENLEKAQQALKQEKEDIEKQIAARVKLEKNQMEQVIRKSLSEQNTIEIQDLKTQLLEKSQTLEQAQRTELELRKKARELTEKEQTLTLELERKLDSERVKIQEETSRRVLEETRLRSAEKDKQLEDMRRQIEDLKRKAEQGSQQTQGEVLELEIEAALAALFPHDTIQPVPKGMKGGDIIQTVITFSGQKAGTIIWETKRTKHWSDQWIEKLKEDQRLISAECAVIITETLPKNTVALTCIEGVWVVDVTTFKGIALALRTQLIQLHQAKAMATGKGEKLDFLYDYLTGTQFKQRVEAIVEAFQSMQSDLEKEKRALQKMWATREQQIQKVVGSTVGLYGDIQGIVGHSLPRIAPLELDETSEGLPDS